MMDVNLSTTGSDINDSSSKVAQMSSIMKSKIANELAMSVIKPI